MKTFFFLAVLVSSVIIFSSCESSSGKKLKEKLEQKQKSKADTLLFSPEKIGVTKLLKEFIPYPQYDGGTGMRVSFSIGIQYKGKTYEVDVHGSNFFRENVTEEKAKTHKSISDLVLTHYLVSNTPKGYLDVVVVKGEVLKLTRRATFFPDGTFYPTQIIWEKK